MADFSSVAVGAKTLLLESAVWHVDCFRCIECNRPIGSRSYYEHQDQPVCVGCYRDKYARKCFKCKEVSYVVGVCF